MGQNTSFTAINEVFRPPDLPLTTNAAEGLLRRRFTVAELDQMAEAGILSEDERIELIGGRSSRCRRRAISMRF